MEPKFLPVAKSNEREMTMSVVAILVISSFFVLAAMAGLADALVHFVCWGVGQLTTPRSTAESVQPPTRGITA